MSIMTKRWSWWSLKPFKIKQMRNNYIRKIVIGMATGRYKLISGIFVIFLLYNLIYINDLVNWKDRRVGVAVAL